MKARILGAATLALSALVAVPAAAQVNGIAVADPAVAVAGSQALQTAAQANTAVITQVQGLDQQINTIQQPIALARVFVIEQLAQQLSPAVQAVVQANSIQLILNPASALYIADPVDVTDEIIAQLNTLAPAVSTAVPQGWQPQPQSAQLFQQVQEILVSVAQQQAAQQQQPAAAPAATPVPGR